MPCLGVSQGSASHTVVDVVVGQMVVLRVPQGLHIIAWLMGEARDANMRAAIVNLTEVASAMHTARRSANILAARKWRKEVDSAANMVEGGVVSTLGATNTMLVGVSVLGTVEGSVAVGTDVSSKILD